jgi:hypothetical protein
MNITSFIRVISGVGTTRRAITIDNSITSSNASDTSTTTITNSTSATSDTRTVV